MSMQVLALNVVTFDITEELPLSACSFTIGLNDRCSWSMDLPLSTANDGHEKLSNSTMEVNKTCVVFIRDGVPLFMGWMTQEENTVAEGAESMQIGGPSAAVGFLQRRMITSLMTFTATDQILIADDLVDRTNPLGLNIETRYDALSGVLRDRTYFGPERRIVGDMLDDLAQLDDGFDYVADVEGTQATGFTPIVRLGYPNLLRRTSFVLDLDKNIISLRRKIDGDQTANRVSVQGDSMGEFALVGTVQDSSLWSTYPMMDAVFSKPTVQLQSTLNNHGAKYVRINRHPPTELSLIVDTTNHDSTPGSFRVGDEFRVIANRGRLDLDSIYRVKSWTLSTDANGSETMTMTMVETGDLS